MATKATTTAGAAPAATSLKDLIQQRSEEATLQASEKHPIKALGGLELEFRPMPAGLRSKLLNTGITITRVMGDKGKMVDQQIINYEEYFPQVIAATTYNPATGERVYDDSEEDKLRIAALGTPAHDEMAGHGMRVSGLTKAAQAALKNDSSATPTVAPSPGSPEN